MTKRDIIIFLFKWKYTLIGHFVFIVAAVSYLSYVLPPQYDAKAVILIESNMAPAMRTDVAFGVDQAAVLFSETEIIISHTVLAATVDRVGVADEAPTTQIGRLIETGMTWLEEVGLKEPITPRDAMIRKLDQDLEVEAIPSSNIIEIAFSGKEPRRAADIVNAVTDSYIEHHLKIYSGRGSEKVYKRQVDRLAGELDQLRRQLADYKRDAKVSALADTMRSLVQLQSELNDKLNVGRKTLAELQTRFGPGHTSITLAQEGIRTNEQSLVEAQAQLAQLEQHSENIAEMENRIASVEASYREYDKRHEEERLVDLSNTDVVNVRVVEYSEVANRPSHSRIFYILLAIAGAVPLALAIALIKEYFDRGVADEDVVAEILGVPTLGSIELA